MPSPARQDRPTLAIVCRTVPPYRQHVHRRIVAEIPELRLITLNTHQDQWRNWEVADGEQIGLYDLSLTSSAKESNERAVSKGPPETIPPGALRQAHRDWKMGGLVIKKLQQENAAAVIVNGYNNLGRLRIIRWCRRHRLPCFIFGDSNIASEHRLPAWKKFFKRQYIGWLVGKASGSFACGRLGKAFWEQYGVAPNKIFIAPYEPDYHQIRSISSSDIQSAMQKHGLTKGRRRLLFSGRLIPVKRPDLLVDAFVALAEQRPEWDLVILGDGDLKESLQKSVPSCLQDRIFWIPFQSEQQEVSAIYRACDLLVLPSNYEPWALVINEAVAAGLAVVATEVVAAAAELVVDGENGYLVPANSLESLCEAIKKATDSQQIDRLQQASAPRLADWQQRGDPVAGIRQALASVGVLTEE